MRKIKQIISKNLKLLLRNKISYFLLFLGPILIVLIMGFFFFNENSYSINLGVYPKLDNENSYIKQFEKNNFEIIYFSSKEKCLDSIKSGLNLGCVFFNKNTKHFTTKVNNWSNVSVLTLVNISNNSLNNLSLNISNINNISNSKLDIENLDEKENLVIIIDNTKTNLAPIVENLLKNSLRNQKEEIQTKTISKLFQTIENNSKTANLILNQSKQIQSANKALEANIKIISIYTEQFKNILNTDSLNIDTIEIQTNSLNANKQKIINDSKFLLNLSKYNLLEIKNITSNANLTPISDKTKIDNLIVDLITEIDILDKKLTSNQDSYNSDNVKKLTSSLKGDLTNIENQLIEISTKVTNSINILNSNSKNITKNLNQINNFGEKINNSYANLEIKTTKTIISPFEFNISKLSKNSSNHLDSLIASVLTTLILVISILLSAIFILVENKNQAHFRNFISKCSSFYFVLGNFLTILFIVSVQVFLIIIIYYWVFLKNYSVLIFPLLVVLLLPIGIFVLFGAIIGYLSNNETQTIVFCGVVIFLLFGLSGNLIPLELISSWLFNLTLYNPFILSEALIRKLIVFDMGISSITFELGVISIYFLVFFLITYVLDSINKKRALYQYFVLFYLKLNKIAKNRVEKSKLKEKFDKNKFQTDLKIKTLKKK